MKCVRYTCSSSHTDYFLGLSLGHSFNKPQFGFPYVWSWFECMYKSVLCSTFIITKPTTRASTFTRRTRTYIVYHINIIFGSWFSFAVTMRMSIPLSPLIIRQNMALNSNLNTVLVKLTIASIGQPTLPSMRHSGITWLNVSRNYLNHNAYSYLAASISHVTEHLRGWG